MRKSILSLAVGALAFVSVPSADAAEILLVSDNAFAAAPTEARTGDPEAPFVSFLESLGHTVVRSGGSGGTAEFRKGVGGAAAAQNVVDTQGIDLVIVSRATNSGEYSETDNAAAGAQRTAWNNIDVPLMLMGPHLARNNRWRWFGTDQVDEAITTPPVTELSFPDPNHPFVAGRGTNLIDAGENRSVTRMNVGTAGNGDIIATLSDGDVAIVSWNPGEEFYAGAGQFAGDTRVFFAGLRYHESQDIDGAGTGAGDPIEFEDLSENGKAILGQTINSLVVPEPGTLSVLALGVVALLRRRRI